MVTRILALMVIAVTIWFVGSFVMSSHGLFDRPNEPPIYFGMFVIVPTLAFVTAYFLSSAVKQTVLAVPLWLITAFHSLRFVGVAFIAGSWSGTLPPAFGWPAGIGDIAAAIFSVPLAVHLYRGRRSIGLRTRYIAWNIFGLADLVIAIALGFMYSVSVLASEEQNTRDLLYLPTSLIPTFYVPMLILLHLVGLSRNRETAA